MDIVELLLQVEEGNENPLKAYAKLKHHLKIVNEAINQIEPFAQEEADDHNNQVRFEYKKNSNGSR